MEIKHSSFKILGAEGKEIIGDITYQNTADNLPILLFIHGFKGFKDWGAHHLVAQYFATKGFRFVKFNLSHSGVTPAKPFDVSDLDTFADNTFSKEIFDVNAVIDYLQQSFGKDMVLNVIGHSRGGGLAIIKTSEDSRINKLITWSAISSFNSLWKKEQEADWKKTGKIYVTNARTKEQMPLNVSLLVDFEQHQAQLNIINAASALKNPWLIVQGDEDVNVPFEHAQTLHNNNPNSLLVKIEGANHVYGVSHPYTENQMPEHLKTVCEKCLAFLKA